MKSISQSLQTNNKEFKIAVTSLTGYNGIFNVENSNNKFYSLKSITDEVVYIQITISPGAYGRESLNNEIKRIIIDEGHYTEANIQFTIKPIFSTLGSIIRISTQAPIITIQPDDSMRDLLGYNKTTL